ncbi:endoglucanase [Kosmotoga pacifica]|uniref:Endoglucanase n=2 Tax=Kosmotoga pacifica TaxID=1330330 RepID=A0A0G2Z9G3_9BACT|nr:endoglucanase [Kosmotoga pacifica]
MLASAQVFSEQIIKGINLGNALEAPKEGQWGVVIENEYFCLIESAGFNTVRIPIRWSAHALEDYPYTIDSAFFDRVDHLINLALFKGLTVIINIHHYEELMNDPNRQKERFLCIWKQLAEHYKNYPATLYFELLNEPHSNLTPKKWNALIKDCIAVIRIIDLTRILIIDAPHWASPYALNLLELPNNENLMVSFHYYEPFSFTHQGAEWVEGSKRWLGTVWKGTLLQKCKIKLDFARAKKWGQKNNIPILLGEFGAYSKAEYDSRVRWTSYISKIAERYEIGWIYWEFCAGFGIYDPSSDKWRQELLEALISPTR